MMQGTARPWPGRTLPKDGPFAHVCKVGCNTSEGRNEVLLPLVLGVTAGVFFIPLKGGFSAS